MVEYFSLVEVVDTSDQVSRPGLVYLSLYSPVEPKDLIGVVVRQRFHPGVFCSFNWESEVRSVHVSWLFSGVEELQVDEVF